MNPSLAISDMTKPLTANPHSTVLVKISGEDIDIVSFH